MDKHRELINKTKEHYNKYGYFYDSEAIMEKVITIYQIGQLIRRENFQGKVVLDIGCGAGRHSGLIKKKSWGSIIKNIVLTIK